MSAGQMSPSAATPIPRPGYALKKLFDWEARLSEKNKERGLFHTPLQPALQRPGAGFVSRILLLDAQLTGTDGLRLQEQRDWVPYEYLNNSNLRLPRTFAMSRLKIRYCTGCEAKRGRSTGELNVVNWRVFTGV